MKEEKIIREICSICNKAYSVPESQSGHCLCSQCAPTVLTDYELEPFIFEAYGF